MALNWDDIDAAANDADHRADEWMQCEIDESAARLRRIGIELGKIGEALTNGK